MQKMFSMNNITVGSTIAWQIVGDFKKDKISLDLKGKNRFYFSEEVSCSTMQLPNAQGAVICEDTDLTLTVSYDKSQGISIQPLSVELLSDCGSKIGNAYHFNGYIAGDEGNAFHIVISVWNRSNNILTEEQFIADCFYKYLTFKHKYLFNYVSDDTVASYSGELDRKSKPIDYKSWYLEKMKTVTSELMQYKLILSLLLHYDKHISNTELRYLHEKNFVMVFGKKQWNETKITIGSCPFQNIRGIALNDTEDSKFNSVYTKLSKISMFSAGKLNAAACHANPSSKLGMEPHRKLNFENIGLNVTGPDVKVEKDVIDKSVKYASDNNAGILIFPELAIEEDVQKYLKSSLGKYGKNLKLVVGGSYYKKTADKSSNDSPFQNLATIYANISGKWEQITDYSKMIPFSMGYTKGVAENYGFDTKEYPLGQYKLLTEDIRMDDNITILPFKDCVIGVAICRDAMDLLDTHNPLHKYCDFVDVMLVISDNNGDSNMFVGTAECLARWHNCATIYTNTIEEALISSEPDSHLEISFAIYPYKGAKVSGSTSVSGEIDYAKKPFEAIDLDGGGMVSILYSKGIEYSSFTAEELKNCCKIYTVEAAK